MGGFKGQDGKEGLMLVNVEDTSKQKSLTAKLHFNNPISFKVYKDGKYCVKAFDTVAEITLGVGEGIFMIEE